MQTLSAWDRAGIGSSDLMGEGGAVAEDDWRDNPLITEALGPNYVYLLIDPDGDEVFYVGKGTGWRFAAHLVEDHVIGDEGPDEELGAKQRRIDTIRARGDQPRVEFARRQIQTETEAYLVEAALIDVLRRHGPRSVVNAVRGHGADLGLITLDELQEQVATPDLTTVIPAILIKLSWWVDEQDTVLPRNGYGFKRGMSQEALYDSTRAWWRLNIPRARDFEYAIAVFQGVTRGAWRIDQSAWRSEGGKVAFGGHPLEPGDVAYEDFVGTIGRRVPAIRVDGRAVFGTGQPLAYWP